MKVLLLSVNTLMSPYPVYPLGLDYVAAALVPKHTVRIADMNSAGIEDLGRIIDDFQPDAVGMSLRNIDNTDTTEPRGFMSDYHRVIKVVRSHTQASVILGGAGFSIFPKEILTALAADYGIVGEGERLSSLLDALAVNGPVEAIPGVVTSNGVLCAPAPITHGFRRRFDPGYEHLPF
jgi:radical SAM superfamily enzyme YgiQ (UPF0313 family)